MGAENISIIAGDPAESGDAFGLFGVEVNVEKSLIYAKYAHQWNKTPFAQVAHEVKPIWRSVHPTIFALEKNNNGDKAIEAFRAVKIPVMPVFTTGLVSDRNRCDVMDKAFTTEWASVRFREHKVRVPRYHSIFMELWLDQLRQIRRYHTPSGRTTYKAMRNRHDDIFSASLVCFHLARLYLEGVL